MPNCSAQAVIYLVITFTPPLGIFVPKIEVSRVSLSSLLLFWLLGDSFLLPFWPSASCGLHRLEFESLVWGCFWTVLLEIRLLIFPLWSCRACYQMWLLVQCVPSLLIDLLLFFLVFLMNSRLSTSSWLDLHSNLEYSIVSESVFHRYILST